MKKIIVIVGTILLLIILVGMYKFNYLASKQGYDVDGNKIEQKNRDRNKDLCDESGNRYKNAQEAEKAGLSKSEYGTTFCPEYKMHPSWDINKDGINDCYESNSCSEKIDYMSPRSD